LQAVIIERAHALRSGASGADKNAHMGSISRNIQQDVPAREMLLPASDIVSCVVSVALDLIAR
jgi:hypothetical protein